LEVLALLYLSFAAIWLAWSSRSEARSKDTGFLDGSLLLQGRTYRYQVFVPED
jgi:hypothetical protein